MAFTANGDCLVAGGPEGVHVRRVQDGKQMETLGVRDVECLAVSTDGRWIAAGTLRQAFIWDTRTYKQVFELKDGPPIRAVDFSPDSTRLVAARGLKAIIWDIATCQRALVLQHGARLTAAKYSPQGDLIAAGTRVRVRVWDSNDGRWLFNIDVAVILDYNAGLRWSNNHLFVACEGKIKKLDISTRSIVSEWPVPRTNVVSCLALPQHGKFIAYSTGDTITFWDTSTYTQLFSIPRHLDQAPIALSPDDQLFAFVARDGKITVEHLFYITVSFMYCAARQS